MKSIRSWARKMENIQSFKRGVGYLNVYQELQLNQSGSKNLIRGTKNKNEKARHIVIYLFKIFLTLAFCVGFVTVFTKLFGEKNSVAGVVVLLAVMVFKNADLGIKASHGSAVIGFLFLILAFGPKITNLLLPGWAFFFNFIFLLTLLVLGCHNILMANHATWILGYLLLQGNDVTGQDYLLRLAALGLGALMTMFVFYRNHKHMVYKREFRDLFREFELSSLRTKWQLRMALGISSGMFLAQLFHLPRVMWAGFAMMSVIQPFREDLLERSNPRFVGNVVGCGIFFVLCAVMPESSYGMMGILGGIGVGLSATYLWQTVFNSFGALATAMAVFGMTGSMAFRLINNLFGVVYGVIFDYLFDKVCCMIEKSGAADQRTREGAL